MSEITPPAEIFVPAPTDCEVFRGGLGASIRATSSLVRPRLRFSKLLAMPELKLDHNPLTLWPTLAPIPETLAEIVFFVYGSSWGFIDDIAGEIRGSNR